MVVLKLNQEPKANLKVWRWVKYDGAHKVVMSHIMFKDFVHLKEKDFRCVV